MISSTTAKERPARILLVDDNPGDVFLAKKAFASGRISNVIEVAADGYAALSRLLREAPYEDTALPDLVLLDLNLPGMDGKEVLEKIKTNDKLKYIPVIIMTSSLAEIDVVKSYNLHANGYITKPVDPEELIGIARSIEQFWLSIVVLPDETDTKRYTP